MVKMKTSTASYDICMLFCALIVHTLVSTARTTYTTKILVFESEESTTDWQRTNEITTTTNANGVYDTTTISSTPSGTDLNYTMVADDADGKTTESVIVNSPKSTNKEYSSSTTEPTSTNDYNQTKLGESSTRTNEITTTTNANGVYDTTTISGTPSGTDLNYTMVADDADGKTTENVIVNSPKSTNKEYSSSTEPTSTNDYNQTKLGESSTRTQSPSTTPITIQKNGPTTTPKHSTENVTDNSPNQTTPKNGYNLSHKNYSFTERILTKPKIFDITVVTMRNKQKKFPFLDPISSILANRELPTRYYKPAEWIKPTNKNYTCVYGKKISNLRKNNEENTTTTKTLGPFDDSNQWEQQRHMMETTTINYNEQLEKSKKQVQQKILEMESKRFDTILDLFNNRR